MNLIDLYQQKYDELYETGIPEQCVQSFKLPIQYIENNEINSIIKTDLEMPEMNGFEFSCEMPVSVLFILLQINFNG